MRAPSPSSGRLCVLPDGAILFSPCLFRPLFSLPARFAQDGCGRDLNIQTLDEKNIIFRAGTVALWRAMEI
jgi:hypothetical protein